MALKPLLVLTLATGLVQAQTGSNASSYDPLQYVDQLIGASNGGT
jgi:hypothetical protein